MDVIICDDHPVVRAGIRSIISSSLENASIREADSAQSMMELVRERPGDVVVLDVGLPGRGGLDVLRELKRERPRLPVLMLSVHPAEQYALRALRAGASGYLMKDLVAEELVKAVRTVAEGHRYVTPDITERLVDDLTRPAEGAPHELLSDREFEVLRRLSSGRSVREVSDELCLSYNTISTYRSRVMSKLGVTSTAELIRYALHYNLVE
jgi:DNA-binding NarL/FixJ family response regulator